MSWQRWEDERPAAVATTQWWSKHLLAAFSACGDHQGAVQTILGKLNGTFLANTLTQSYPISKSNRAAVAYADFHEPLVEHLRGHPEVRLKFYGRMDETGAVSLRLLEWFLKKAPPTAECFLVNGAYLPPQGIWWHGHGAYIGSANLTRNGWEKNIEAGSSSTKRNSTNSGWQSTSTSCSRSWTGSPSS